MPKSNLTLQVRRGPFSLLNYPASNCFEGFWIHFKILTHSAFFTSQRSTPLIHLAEASVYPPTTKSWFLLLILERELVATGCRLTWLACLSLPDYTAMYILSFFPLAIIHSLPNRGPSTTPSTFHSSLSYHKLGGIFHLDLSTADEMREVKTRDYKLEVKIDKIRSCIETHNWQVDIDTPQCINRPPSTLVFTAFGLDYFCQLNRHPQDRAPPRYCNITSPFNC